MLIYKISYYEKFVLSHSFLNGLFSDIEMYVNIFFCIRLFKKKQNF